MAVQKQDDQHEHTFSNYVRIQDVVQKTCLRRWTIGKSGERRSGISVLPARHDDDNDDIIEKMKKSGFSKHENQCYTYIKTTLAFFYEYTLRVDFFIMRFRWCLYSTYMSLAFSILFYFIFLIYISFLTYPHFCIKCDFYFCLLILQPSYIFSILHNLSYRLLQLPLKQNMWCDTQET